MRKYQLLLLICVFLLFGCISKIDDWDRLDSKVTFNMYEYLSGSEKPLEGPTPCTCMVCTKDNPSTISYVWYKINPFKEKLIETDLYKSQCNFVECNATTYSATLGTYDEKKGVWGKCTITTDINGKSTTVEKACAPRFFMIGQGASSGEFSLAQRYCSGRLTMPVIWTTYDEKEKPSGPNPATLVCHLSKSQMPIVIYHSLDKAPDGKYMASKEYSGIISSFHNLSSDPTIEGPIMATTEAMADPYYLDASGNKMLNISLLQKIGKQLEIIRSNCPDCLSVLALKPTFADDDFPDLCAVDYFLPYSSTLPKDKILYDPYNCTPKYPSGSSYATRPAALGTYADKIDIVGVAFIANNKKNMTNSCTPASDVDRHLAYSEFVLKNYLTPTVWYAVGMSAGPTLSEGCSFSQTQIAQEYDALIKKSAGFVQAGVIGVAPYKFLDSPSALPLECNSMRKVLTTSQDLSSLSDGDTITSADAKKTLKAYKVFFSSDIGTYFRDESGRTYLSYRTMQNTYEINETGCQFGFRSPDGALRAQEAFMWFSSCQYYFTNKGFLFTSDLKSLDEISEDDTISSSDSRFNANVYSILSRNSSSVTFLGTDNIRYLALQDGPNQVDIYDMPYENYTQQPIIFSANGVQTYQCNAFEAGSGSKLFYRSQTAKTMPSDASLMEPPLDVNLQKQVSQMQCGACMFDTPMPKEFCALEITRTVFTKDACTDYPQIDDVFLLKNSDPVAMRSLAIGESGLGADIDSSMPPACAISRRPDGANCGGGDKSPSVLTSSQYLPYCPSNKITNWINSRGIDGKSVYACALGLMQCTEAPGASDSYTRDCGGSSYNPFNPYNSACCGANKFNEYYALAKTKLESLRQSNPDIAAEITSEKFDWYAAVLAAHAYSRGPGSEKSKNGAFGYPFMDKLRSYQAGSTTFAQHILNTYDSYGFAFAIRYNNGILECASGCPHQSCK
ncbi:MAG: hypothetical protein WC492_02205 [Candidatus Micrarchaeia archaeon]